MYEKFGRAEKVLMRIRALKWQANNILSASGDGLAREEAAAIAAELHTLEPLARAATTDDALAGAETQADALGLRLSHLGPKL